jgi:TolB-like protein/Tfp pilus assembly protein PilF
LAHFFISYASEDTKKARELCDLLASLGATYWIAPESIVPGEDYTLAIPEAIRECEAFLLLFSQYSDESDDVKSEVVLGKKYKKRIVPLRLTAREPEKLEYHLGVSQWIDWYTPEGKTRLRRHVEQVLGAAAANVPSGVSQTLALEQSDTPVNPVGADKAPSIAVLPFANMSPDKDNEYFSDGLAEEILNLLAKIPGLKVIARTSSFAFRGKEQDITKIAETLRVRNILEGSVRKSGNRIRVTVQLIEAVRGSHLWSERYDRDLTDVFAVQDEIGQAISEALKVQLAPRTKPVDIEAWQNYLKGMYHLLRLTPESLAKAEKCLEQALAIDPAFARAYTLLAGYYLIQPIIGIRTTAEVAPLVKSAIEKALAIDPADIDAHSWLAYVAAIVDYDWKAAGKHHRQALALEPVQPLLRYSYAMHYLAPLGRFPEAIEQCRLALESDPLSMNVHFAMAYSMYCAGQYMEAIECARRALEIDANIHLVWFALGMAQFQAGSAGEAITSFKRSAELAPWWHVAAWALAASYHVAGDYEQSQDWVRRLSRTDSYGAAGYFCLTGDVDAMCEALDGAYQRRDPHLYMVAVEPLFDPHRADPRFQSLLRRMNLA